MFKIFGTVIFIFGISIFGRGVYTNAQPAKSQLLIFQLAAALCGMASLRNLFVYYQYFFSTQIQYSKLGCGSGRILNFASYHYFINTQFQKSAEAAADILILIATQYFLNTKNHNQQSGRAGGLISNFEFC